MPTDRYFDDQTKIPGRWWLLLSALAALLLSSVVFLPVYYALIKGGNRGRASLSAPPPALTRWTPLCREEPREPLDCYPEDPTADADRCGSRGCCWRKGETPRCRYPSNYGYAASDKGIPFYDGFETNLVRPLSPSRYGDDLRHVALRVEFQTRDRLRIKFYDPQNARHEVEPPSVPEERSGHRPRLYSVSYHSAALPFGVKVRRVSTDVVLFDTTPAGFTFSHQFLQITVRLPSRRLYGLGEESLRPYRTSRRSTLRTLHASKDRPSAHPVYLCVEDDGNAHGVLLLNGHAMEIELNPFPAVTFRLGGGVLDFYLFLGPTPEDVVAQYTQVVGRPALPPYWSLGFHMGRDGYLSTDHVKWMGEIIKEKNIPRDVQSVHTDYTTGCSFSIRKEFGNLSSLSTELHEIGIKLVISIRPSICTKQDYFNYAYRSGRKAKVFVNDTRSNRPLIGKTDKEKVVYPDFENPLASDWWKTNLRRLSSSFDFDGIWIEGNEPFNSANGSTEGCLDDTLNRPPFVPRTGKRNLYDETLCMDSVHWGWGKRHYHVHNTYGHKSALVSYKVLKSLKEARPSVLSPSTFPGSGGFAGRWIREDKGTWSDMVSSIPSLLHYSIFGIPFTGSAICGYRGEPEEELCLRWLQLGAFYPLSRHHKAAGYRMWINNCNSNEEDPGNFKKEFVKVVRKAMEKRYELLPYLYTLFYFAHVRGSTVARPLWHQFTKDNATFNIEEQFLWGPALLISPALQKNVTSVKAYFPKGFWYDYYTGEKFSSDGGWETLSAPLYGSVKPINLHLYGGHVVTTQKSALNTELSRRNPLRLLVALNESRRAEGWLFWDDGISNLGNEYILVKYAAFDDKLTVEGNSGSKTFETNFHRVYIEQIRIMGLQWPPDYVKINNNYLLKKKQYRWADYSKTLDLQNILISLTQRTVIHWFD
ncbi:lysosomal alpha-glucosidase-like [Centruroides vittatus]|uniref:lysosomal alpha-glucosidase-like n=1 Tax=Centruroides vittatus TaxID=120091 RepID=UPI00350F337E